MKWRREAAIHHGQGTPSETTHSRVWQRPQFVSKCWPGNSDLGEYLSETYSNVPEVIIRTKPKQPHVLFPGTSPTWKRLRFWERRELTRCFLWVNRRNGVYCIFYAIKTIMQCMWVNAASEHRTWLKEAGVERRAPLPSFQSSTLLCSPSEDGAQALFTPTLRQTWVSRPTSYGPQHQTAAQQSHLGCYIPRHCCLLSRTYDPVLDSTEPWLHHCKVPMLWELFQALHEKIQGSS